MRKLTESLVTHLFLCIIYCITNAVAVKNRKDILFNKVTCCCFRVASQNGLNQNRPQPKTALLLVKTAQTIADRLLPLSDLCRAECTHVLPRSLLSPDNL